MTIDRFFKSSRVLPARALLLVRRVSLLRSWHQAHTVIKGLAGLENHRGARRSVAIQVAVFEGPRSSCEKALFTGEWGPVCLTLDLIRTASQEFLHGSVGLPEMQRRKRGKPLPSDGGACAFRDGGGTSLRDRVAEREWARGRAPNRNSVLCRTEPRGRIILESRVPCPVRSSRPQALSSPKIVFR